MIYEFIDNEAILPFALIVLAVPFAIGIISITIGNIKNKKSIRLIEKGDYFINNEKYEDALDFYLPQYEFFKNKFGMSNLSTVNIGKRIAKTYACLSEFSLAQKFAYSLEDYHNNILGEDDYEQLIHYYTLCGNIKDGLGEYEKALEYYDKIFVICDRVGDKADIQRAKCCWNKAIVLDRIGSYGDAWVNYTTAIRIFESADGDYKELIGRVYFNLGISSYLQKKFDEALVQFDKALNISQGISKMHPNTAACYHFTGCIYHEKGFHEEAIVSLLEALYIRLKTIGNEHPHYGETYDKIKQFYLESNLPEEDFRKWIENKLKKYFSSEKQKSIP